MQSIKRPLRLAFAVTERVFDRAFGPAWNPLHNLGALGFFYYWIVAVSGIYLYIGFDTGVERVYASIERLTHAQWYLGGVMRSLHRYASDALVAMALLHLLREFSFDRMRGVRWFSWLTGVPILWLVYASGVSGYWLVWDELAQYIALTTSEWLDALPFFGEPIARNFLAPNSLDDRFFTLLIFMHIAIPLILLFILWVHLQRLSKPRINPPRGLAIGTLAMMLALSLVHPAVSQPPADLAKVPGDVGLDWFYLAAYPLFDHLSYAWVWGLAGVLTVGLAALPWLPPLRRPRAAVVDLEHCNGCGRCVQDCPYAAVAMVPRSDGQPFAQQAVVDAALCVGCGICMAACPPSMPFRRIAELATGIDVPDASLNDLRERTHAAAERLSVSPRVLVFGCDCSVDMAALANESVAGVSLPCIGALPPSFVDYVLSRGLADGVFLTGGSEGACVNRLGIQWTELRMDGERDPRLRDRVPRERMARRWAARHEATSLAGEIAAFRAQLATLPAIRPPAPAQPADIRETVA
ncbi:MAG: cytochrome b N-terminal domain-containing protein [Alphaproteobacteria bacterium]|nr:cytochrome b N-terminal domain-containing protein [Alphaproteobacteria bacterium]